jgi:tetratricopeptide (TPR) repeat protein
VAVAVHVAVGPDERTRITTLPTADAEAYEHYVRGSAYAARLGPDAVPAAVEFQRAVELDPDFAEAHAALALPLLWQEWTGGSYAPRSLRVQAREAVDAAVPLAPDDVETLIAEGLYHYFGEEDYPRALDKLLAAQRVSPSHPTAAFFVGGLLRRLGRWEGAVDAMERALELDPRSGHVRDLAIIHVLAGNADAALDQLEIVRSVHSSVTPHTLRLDPIWDPLRERPRFRALVDDTVGVP